MYYLFDKTENQPESQIFKKKKEKTILVEFALPCLALRVQAGASYAVCP